MPNPNPSPSAASTPGKRAPAPGRFRGPLARAAREPLVHFFLLGGAVFALDAVLNPPDRTDRVITVTRAMRDSMRSNFDEDRERPATDAELNAMVENWVASEILYREGKRLGVDRGDDAIRDRVAFKLQLMIFSQLSPPSPTEAELRNWFEANRARFDEPRRASFYLGPATDGPTARAQLAAVLAGTEPDGLKTGTRALIGRPVPSLAASFGEPFRDALLALPLERWSVLQSREGWHLVRLDSVRDAVPARLADVMDDAVRTFQTDETRRRAWDAVQRLRANYAVRLEP